MSGMASFPKIYLYRRIVHAKLFIDGHYHQAINLDDIADEAFFSKFHFIRLFKTTYGKTPHQYLIAVRVEQARLLLQKGASVTEACYAVGFDSVTSFSALFKKVILLSPSVYQQRELQRAADMVKAPLKFIPNCFAQENGWV
ncbi:helix-turn-helix domain-containing protein [Mucilaginibacter ginsenosidivorax]|uniref:Helix-turn-helix transcriptional regulator n=1 Tax=Mucilaginibacter ginsenosidivorax TaxID=862126 RepID=A0A5B8W2K4_9SPHI|nr:AraC family transcriptional regulator [Mucilaginibacter ginsenosidivorax]QEC78290.1 helix-turn-helix transcriptional regulator [Mucilaginibacter ginsenosidivorax]